MSHYIVELWQMASGLDVADHPAAGHYESLAQDASDGKLTGEAILMDLEWLLPCNRDVAIRFCDALAADVRLAARVGDWAQSEEASSGIAEQIARQLLAD